MKKNLLCCLLCVMSGIVVAQSAGSATSDLEQLKALNRQFITNFLNDDTVAHNKIIHQDFVCIESSGKVIPRHEYMKSWASDYRNSGYTSFTYKEEAIRIFGNMALVRSVTPFTRLEGGKTVNGATIYTDTYIKENGRWWCVQAQLTAVR